MNEKLKKYYLTIDIGGTTFTSALFNTNLELISISEESYVGDYIEKESLINGIADKIKNLCSENKVNLNQVYALGISAPGPLDSIKGKILDTPNLFILKNTYLAKELEDRLSIPVKLENDANLFTLGEWYLKYKMRRVFVGLTLGSGLGFGIIIDEKLFTGAHGMAAEYGISPFGDGVWEDDISINGINNLSKKFYDKIYSPKEIFTFAINQDKIAFKIWDHFGYSLGLALSHIVNLLDPEMISIGGGLSNAFKYFNKNMINTLVKYSPSFNHHNIEILQCKHYLHSIHQGAVLLINKEKKYQ
jgi:glucokinase